jgi:hypothetical protein
MAADKTTKVLEVIVDNNKAVSAIAEYNQLIDEQKAKQKELAESYKTGKISQVDYQNSMAKSKEEIKAYNRSVQELSKEIQNNVKQAQEQEGSLRGLRAQLSNLTKEYDALGRAERQGGAGQALVAQINQITTELKEAEAETQRFYRNVGNYPDVKPLESQLSDLKKQLAQLKFEGKDNTEEFAALSEEAGRMKDALADVEQQINATASDTKGLDTAMMGLTTVMGGLSLLGPMFAEGSEEAEEFNKILQKMQAIMMILNTLRTIQNATQKQGLLYQTAEAVKLKAINVLKTMEAKATAAQTAATVKQTIAQKALNLVMKANPVMLLVTGLAALAGGIAAVAGAISSSSDEMEKSEEEIAAMTEAIEKQKATLESMLSAMRAVGRSESEVLTTRIRSLLLILSQDAPETVKEDLRNDIQETTNSLLALAQGWAVAYEVATETEGLTKLEKNIKAINRELGAQYQALNQLRNKGLITQDEYDKALQYTVSASDSAILAAQEAEAAQITELLRKAADERIALIEDENERARELEETRHALAIDELETRLDKEKDLTSTERALINHLIELEEQKHQQKMKVLDTKALQEDLKEQENIIRLKLEAVEEGSQAEYELKLQQLERQRDLELANTELTEEQKNLIRQKYQAQQDELRKTYNNKVLQEAQELVKLEWENRINEAANQGQNVLQLEIDAAKARLDALHQMEGESDAEFKARQLEAEQEYLEAKKNLADYEVEITQAKMEALEGLVGGLSQIMSAFGEENEKMAKAAKILALGEIAVNTGKAIAAGVAEAAAAGPFPANIGAIGATIAAVLTNIATAVTTVKSAKFATGGLVTGPGSGTSDSIPARLSNGESVINARSTAMFSPLLSALNQAGGGVPFNPAASGSQEGFAFIAAAVETGMKNADLRVGVDEITRVNRRVGSIKEISRI